MAAHLSVRKARSQSVSTGIGSSPRTLATIYVKPYSHNCINAVCEGHKEM